VSDLNPNSVIKLIYEKAKFDLGLILLLSLDFIVAHSHQVSLQNRGHLNLDVVVSLFLVNQLGLRVVM
jgi:hypothetical protein